MEDSVNAYESAAFVASQEKNPQFKANSREFDGFPNASGVTEIAHFLTLF